MTSKRYVVVNESHCPRWYPGGSCSYCGAPQPKFTKPELETTEPKPLSAADKAIYDQIAGGYGVKGPQ